MIANYFCCCFSDGLDTYGDEFNNTECKARLNINSCKGENQYTIYKLDESSEIECKSTRYHETELDSIEDYETSSNSVGSHETEKISIEKYHIGEKSSFAAHNMVTPSWYIYECDSYRKSEQILDKKYVEQATQKNEESSLVNEDTKSSQNTTAEDGAVECTQEININISD